MQTFTVSEEQNGQRIDQALTELMDSYSRAYVQKLIRNHLVKINGKVAKKGNRVETDDQVEVGEMVLKESKFGPTDIPLDIIYEDDDFLIVNKPPGLLTHPSPHEREHTLVNALLHHCGDRLSGIGGEKRPGIVHRLDKDTSGILMVAKHDESHKDLANQIQDRKVEKHYLALVVGKMASSSGTIEAPMKKVHGKEAAMSKISIGQEAKDATTHFDVVEELGGEDETWSLLDVQIITGRMHQIRVHLEAIQHPVVGDKLYGNRKANQHFKELGLQRQFLHAWKLKFRHPRTHEWVEFEAPLADDLKQIMEQLTP